MIILNIRNTTNTYDNDNNDNNANNKTTNDNNENSNHHHHHNWPGKDAYGSSQPDHCVSALSTGTTRNIKQSTKLTYYDYYW